MTNRHGRWISLPRPLPPGNPHAERKVEVAAKAKAGKVEVAALQEELREVAKVAALREELRVRAAREEDLQLQLSQEAAATAMASAELAAMASAKGAAERRAEATEAALALLQAAHSRAVQKAGDDACMFREMQTEEAAERALLVVQCQQYSDGWAAEKARAEKAEEGMEAAEQRAGAAKRMELEWQRSNKSVVAMWTAETARAEQAEEELALRQAELCTADMLTARANNHVSVLEADLEAANRRANELEVVLLRNGFRRVTYEQ